ncbi:hypothetical protein Tco_0683798, partial [Tanacetum coccineum]
FPIVAHAAENLGKGMFYAIQKIAALARQRAQERVNFDIPCFVAQKERMVDRASFSVQEFLLSRLKRGFICVAFTSNVYKRYNDHAFVIWFHRRNGASMR